MVHSTAYECLCVNGIQRGMVQRPAKMVALVILPACFLAGQVARQAGPICASAILSGAYSRVRVLVLVCYKHCYDKKDRVACRRYGVGQYDNLNTMRS